MEARLTSSNTTLILVTHDRAFMESVCTGILELDQGTAHLHSFGGPGSYDRFRQVCICAELPLCPAGVQLMSASLWVDFTGNMKVKCSKLIDGKLRHLNLAHITHIAGISTWLTSHISSAYEGRDADDFLQALRPRCSSASSPSLSTHFRAA